MGEKDLFITFGFLLPPKGEAVDFNEYPEFTRHYEYCKYHLQHRAMPEIQRAFGIFIKKAQIEIPHIDVWSLYTDFYVKVLGWCKVGNYLEPDKKIITCISTMDWHDTICEEYKSYGFQFDYIPGIEIASLLEDSTEPY